MEADQKTNFVEEMAQFERIVATFKDYRDLAMARVLKAETCLSALPIKHQELLRDYKEHLLKLRQCVDENAKVVGAFVEDRFNMFENSMDYRDCDVGVSVPTPTVCDLEKVQATLKQIVRDWTAEGEEERRQCYQPILDSVEKYFSRGRKKVNVLVPGAGLGRLVYELARRGYDCQGNEFSYFMLLTSHFILNKCSAVNEYTIYPWVHQYTNNVTCETQTQAIQFPDIPMQLVPVIGDISMAAGDFMEIYKNDSCWSCVATCFFIDCSNNIVAFIEKIYRILKPGGIWVNLGPLLYHFADSLTEPSVEPPLDIVLHVINKIGFIIEELKNRVETKYAQNPNSMLQHRYQSVFFVCRKPSVCAENYESATSNDSSDSKGNENNLDDISQGPSSYHSEKNGIDMKKRKCL